MKDSFYTPEQLREVKAFVIKKLGLSEKEFEDIMGLPVMSHTHYPSYNKIMELGRKLRKIWNTI